MKYGCHQWGYDEVYSLLQCFLLGCLYDRCLFLKNVYVPNNSNKDSFRDSLMNIYHGYKWAFHLVGESRIRHETPNPLQTTTYRNLSRPM